MPITNSDFSAKVKAIANDFNPQEDLLSDSFEVVKRGSVKFAWVKLLKFVGFETDCNSSNMLNNLHSQIKSLNAELRNKSSYEISNMNRFGNLPSSENMLKLNGKISGLRNRIFKGQNEESSLTSFFGSLDKDIKETVRLAKKGEDANRGDAVKSYDLIGPPIKK